MSGPDEKAQGGVATRPESFEVNVRIKRSALWMAMLLVFPNVDIFRLYRPDLRADIEAGEAVRKQDREHHAEHPVRTTMVVATIGEWNCFILGSALEVTALATIAYYAWTWPTLGSTEVASQT